MSEYADDPRPPRPPMTPGQPLPRVTRFPMPPEDPEPPRKKKAKDRAKSKSGEKGQKTTILEEATPNLDTYETRRTIRIVVGVAASAAVLLAIFLVAGLFRGAEPEEGFPEDNAPPPGAQAKPSPERAEREARLTLADARKFAEKGDADLTLKRLKAVVEGYPNTAAAAEAREALARGDQGLPLFVDVPLVIARAVPPPVEPERQPDVIAVPPAPPTTPGPTEVLVAPPPVPPEPRKETGLSLERADVPPKPLPEGFRARPESGVHPSGWPLEITCDQDGASMVLVPGGSFLMGRDDGPAVERPAHRVMLSTYYIDQHEVTVRQYDLFVKATGHRPPGGPDEAAATADPALPVVRVSAQDAWEYAQWARKDLPTEAQWELAARTIDGRPHPWGAGEPVWDPPRKPGQIDPVMSFALDLSPYGAYDLAGNVREWTLDWFDPQFYQQFRTTPVAVDPSNRVRGKSRSPEVTIKGGSASWISSWRAGMRPTARLPDLGFRCVLPVERSVPPPGAPPTPGGGAPGGAVPF
jgi:sulfatase modifying factor 1